MLKNNNASGNFDIPVVVFAYNRPSTTQKVIHALQMQTNVPQKIIVFIDKVKNPNDYANYKQVVESFKSISWTDVSIFLREENYGCANNIIAGLNQVFQSFNNAIIVEDDILVANSFYQSLCILLRHYESEKAIFSVGGYPSILPSSLKNDSNDIFLSPRFSSWGWGTWEDRWKKFDLLHWKNPFNNVESIPLNAGDDIRTMAIEVKNNPDLYWDIKIALSCLRNNYIHALTKYYLVNNIGLKSGDHPDPRVDINEFANSFNPIEDRIPSLLSEIIPHPHARILHQEYVNSVREYKLKKAHNNFGLFFNKLIKKLASE